MSSGSIQTCSYAFDRLSFKWYFTLATSIQIWSWSRSGVTCLTVLLFLLQLSRRGSDSWPKLWKLRVHLDVGLGLSLCAVLLLQFVSQRSEEVRSECQSKVVARTVIKTVNDEEGTNSRLRRREEFIPNRQEDVKHDEETSSGSIVNRSGSKSTWVCLSRYSN